MPSAYEIAKQVGGKHRGMLRQLDLMGPRQRKAAVGSYEEQITLHPDKIANPENDVRDWFSLREGHRTSLLRGWQKEINDHREQIEIIKGYEDEHS